MLTANSRAAFSWPRGAQDQAGSNGEEISRAQEATRKALRGEDGGVGVVCAGLLWVGWAGAGGKLPGLRSTPGISLASGAGEEEG